MGFSDEQLNRIYDRTDGRCHICGGGLAFRNYGLAGARGPWEVDHSHPRAKGGTDRSNNLYAAHISCNRGKGAGSTKAARRRHGLVRAPLSAEEREGARRANAADGALVGGIAGLLVLRNPTAALLAAAICAMAAYDADPEG